MTYRLIPVHGGPSVTTLTPCLVPEPVRTALSDAANQYSKVPLSDSELGDVYLLGSGAYTPLKGFMGYEDWRRCCTDMQLENGVFWPIPITLSCDKARAKRLRVGEKISLVSNTNQTIVAVMTISEIFQTDHTITAKHIYKTEDQAHPGVKQLFSSSQTALAGEVDVIAPFTFSASEESFPISPQATRDLFDEKGWTNVAALQMRNPMHRAHEYLAKVALEICDGVLIHSVLGALKPGDVPADVRLHAINTLLKQYFPDKGVIHGGYPLAMRYAGPREALLHALIRQNYGCRYLIVGRDHAGVGQYYGHYEAQRIFDEIPSGALEIKPLKMSNSVWCQACMSMVTEKTCPHHPETMHQYISGSELRYKLLHDETIHDQFSRPEVLAILKDYYRSLNQSERSYLRSVNHG